MKFVVYREINYKKRRNWISFFVFEIQLFLEPEITLAKVNQFILVVNNYHLHIYLLVVYRAKGCCAIEHHTLKCNQVHICFTLFKIEKHNQKRLNYSAVFDGGMLLYGAQTITAV